MGLWLMYVSINEVLVTGYQLDATAAKNWKLQNFCKFFTSHIHMLLIQLLIWWYIPFENKLKTITFLGKQCSIWRNKKKSVTKVSLLVCMYSISKTVGIFTDSKDSITCRFHSVNKETSMFCFWFHESYLLDKYCLWLHNFHAEMLNVQSFQVEVSSNKHHLLWGSLISFRI